MDLTALTAVIGAVGTVCGASGALAGKLLFRRQHERILEATAADVRSTADSRIIDAAADLVTQSGDVMRQYGERIARNEQGILHQAAENDRLRAELADVRSTVTIVSADNAELRGWAAAAVVWMQRAVTEIERLNGHIDPPPAPPEPRTRPYGPHAPPWPAAFPPPAPAPAAAAEPGTATP